MIITDTKLKYFLSLPRFDTYLLAGNYDINKAFLLYQSNIEISEAFYPVLAVLEISLRNAINEQMCIYFSDSFWFQNNLPAEFQPYIKDAIQKLTTQRKNITADRIIAELNFGFWNRLFSRYNANLLWKPLRLIFQNIPKHLRQRAIIDDALYRIRSIRNKIYHYEPVFQNLTDIERQYNEMITFLIWLDNDLPEILNGIDRFKEIFNKAKSI